MDVAIRRHPHGSGFADLDDGDRLASAPVGNRGLDGLLPGVEACLVLVDEDEVEGVDEAVEAAVIREGFIPAEVPRCGYSLSAQSCEQANPMETIMRIET